MKRNYMLVFKLLVSWLGLAFWSMLLTILMFPYQVFRVLVPKPKPGRPGGHPWSKMFRKAFEHKQTRKFIGAGLAILMIFSGMISNTLAVNEIVAEETLVELPKTEVLTETSLNLPLKGVIGQGYHGFHRAIDILAPMGAEIKPIAKGKVIEASFWRLGWGHTVVLDHGEGLVSRYAHLKEIRVIEGEMIDEEFSLGTVGMTGFSTGPHLHLEIYQNGKSVNPLSVLPEFENNLAYLR